MSKLVIKQDLPEVSLQEKLESLLRTALPLLLFFIVIATAVSLYLTRDASVYDGIVIDDTTSMAELPANYTRSEARLLELRRQFEAEAKVEPESYDKHAGLATKADELLALIAVMDSSLAPLSLPAETKQALLERHQYQKDYWAAKRAFHALRLTRFAEKPADAAPQEALPADFCPLFGPGAAACRPGADNK